MIHNVHKRYFMANMAELRTEFVTSIVLPAKSDSYVMFCSQSYQELSIDRSLVY